MEQTVRNVAEEGLIRLHRIAVLLDRDEAEEARNTATQGIRVMESAVEDAGGDPGQIAVQVFDSEADS